MTGAPLPASQGLVWITPECIWLSYTARFKPLPWMVSRAPLSSCCENAIPGTNKSRATIAAKVVTGTDNLFMIGFLFLREFALTFGKQAGECLPGGGIEHRIQSSMTGATGCQPRV